MDLCVIKRLHNMHFYDFFLLVACKGKLIKIVIIHEWKITSMCY